MWILSTLVISSDSRILCKSLVSVPRMSHTSLATNQGSPRLIGQGTQWGALEIELLDFIVHWILPRIEFVNSFLEDPAGWASTIIAGASLAWNVLQQFQIHSIRRRDDLSQTDLEPFLDSTSNSIVYFRLVGPLTMYDVRIPPQATFGTSPYTPLLAKRLRPNQICHTGFTGENAVLLLPDDFEIEWRSSHMSRSHKIRVSLTEIKKEAWNRSSKSVRQIRERASRP